MGYLCSIYCGVLQVLYRVGHTARSGTEIPVLLTGNMIFTHGGDGRGCKKVNNVNQVNVNSVFASVDIS